MLHTIQNEYLSVTVSEEGAQLQSVLGRDGTQYLWQGDPAYWPDRAPNLFPYVARLPQGSYFLDGQLHHMRIHGIAPYSRFAIQQQEGKIVCTLRADEKTAAEYPRDFVFRVVYGLRGPRVCIDYEVENRDSRTMYFGLGGHPGFCVPLVPKGKFEDYYLRFAEPAQPERVGFTKDCFVDGTVEPFPLLEDRILKLRHGLFDEDAIVLQGMCRQVTLESEKDSHSVTVGFPDMPYLGLWHWPKTDAPYVCIEPWCSLPARAGQLTVLEEQADLIRLEPGKSYGNHWFIEIT